MDRQLKLSDRVLVVELHGAASSMLSIRASASRWAAKGERLVDRVPQTLADGDLRRCSSPGSGLTRPACSMARSMARAFTPISSRVWAWTREPVPDRMADAEKQKAGGPQNADPQAGRHVVILDNLGSDKGRVVPRRSGPSEPRLVFLPKILPDLYP